jgi:hypothetical protein
MRLSGVGGLDVSESDLSQDALELSGAPDVTVRLVIDAVPLVAVELIAGELTFPTTGVK